MGKVSDLYHRRVAEGRITPDAAQQSVLPHLDRVLDDIAALPAPEKRSAWRAFLGVGSPPPTPAPRGLYLWGGVGRGKSMLMDLMAEAATHSGRDPDRVSFVAALRITRQTLAHPGAFPP